MTYLILFIVPFEVLFNSQQKHVNIYYYVLCTLYYYAVKMYNFYSPICGGHISSCHSDWLHHPVYWDRLHQKVSDLHQYLLRFKYYKYQYT